VQAYYGALLQQQGIAVAEEGVRRAEHQERMAQTRLMRGLAARLDVTRAGVEVANAKAVLIRARSASDTALQALRAVMSQDDPNHCS
jgi:outer membrane protein TolC